MKRLFGYFVKLFESDARWVVRVAAAGGCGLVIALSVVWQARAELSVPEVIATLVGVPAFMTVAGIWLATADTIRRRLHAGQPVGFLSRLLFGAGIWSLLVWLIVFLIVGFPLAVWLGNMTGMRAAG